MRHAATHLSSAGAFAPTISAEPRSSGRDYGALITVDPAHFVLGEELARGGMGRIRVARDRRLGRQVAIKEQLGRHGDRARFTREATITARLQHPSIVSVHEAGTWPCGSPFLVMDLVDGRALDAVIAEATSMQQRLALLPNVLAIADAIAYAHGERIVHRDLKPANVLVGRYGQTVVIDWGLARDLREADATGRGTACGTLAYMPPEQACGEPVDERADVYALGAILFHVLAGRPPRDATNLDDLFEAAMRGDVAPLPDGVPPDLLAIVDKALRRDPTERYPHAGELADDLRRFTTGQLVGAHRYSLRQLVWRSVRRHRGAVLVASLALVVVAVLGALALGRIVEAQRSAERQRVVAETSRRDAEGLMDFMLHDLTDSLTPLGRVDLLDAVARRASAYHRARPHRGDPADEARRATTLSRVGDVVLARGDTDEAFAHYTDAVAILDALVARPDPDPRWLEELRAAHVRLGDVHLREGRPASALDAYRAAIPHLRADTTRDEMTVHNRIGGALQAAGDGAAALDAYRAAQAIAIERARDRADHDAQRDRFISHLLVGDLEVARGELAAGLAQLDDAEAIARALAAADDSNGLYKRDLAVAAERVGDARRDLGDLTSAERSYRQAVALHELLAQRDPSNAGAVEDGARTRSMLASVLASTGRTRDALAELDAALAALGSTSPHIAATIYNQIGAVQFDAGELEAARTAYRRALDLRRSLITEGAVDVVGQRSLAIAHEGVGKASLRLGDPAAARAAFRESHAIAATLVTLDPHNVEWRRDLAISHEMLADALLAVGDIDGALRELDRSLAIGASLAALEPASAALAHDLALTHAKRGEVLAAARRVAEAHAALARYQAIAGPLVAAHPEQASWRAALDEVRRLRHGLRATRRP